MTLVMYDAVNTKNLVGLPDADAFAGYVDGAFQTFPLLSALAPAGTHLLSIAVFAIHDADCLDVEPLDATNAQAPAWVKRQQARGAHRPCIYTSVSNVGALVATLRAAGIARAGVRIWSAHYGKGPHMCGPASCGQTTIACDGTQWDDHAHARELDVSHLRPDFFGPAADPPHSPDHLTGDLDMTILEFDDHNACPIALPNGVGRVRFASNHVAKLHVDLPGHAGADLDIDYAVTDGVNIPDGMSMIVVHRTDDGTNLVSYSIAH